MQLGHHVTVNLRTNSTRTTIAIYCGHRASCLHARFAFYNPTVSSFFSSSRCDLVLFSPTIMIPCSETYPPRVIHTTLRQFCFCFMSIPLFFLTHVNASIHSARNPLPVSCSSWYPPAFSFHRHRSFPFTPYPVLTLKIISCKVVHGDLKPANFVLVQGRLKLIDFGIAKAISNDTTNISRDSQASPAVAFSFLRSSAFVACICDESIALLVYSELGLQRRPIFPKEGQEMEQKEDNMDDNGSADGCVLGTKHRLDRFDCKRTAPDELET